MERPGQLRRAGQTRREARREARPQSLGKVRAGLAALERTDVRGLDFMPFGDSRAPRRKCAVPEGRLTTPTNTVRHIRYGVFPEARRTLPENSSSGDALAGFGCT